MFLWIYAHMKITERYLNVCVYADRCVYTDGCVDVSISIPSSLTICSRLYTYKHMPYIHMDTDICNLDIAIVTYIAVCLAVAISIYMDTCMIDTEMDT